MEAFLQNSEIIFRIIKETTPSLYLIISLITEPPKRIKMKEMNIAYLSSAYLAPVEYYTKLLAYDKVFVEQYDHYIKQTYRNRCTIASPSGELALSIPTVKPDTLKCPMKDIRISDHGNWRHLHWNAIESAYNNTPFFEYYKDDFRPFNG